MSRVCTMTGEPDYGDRAIKPSREDQGGPATKPSLAVKEPECTSRKVSQNMQVSVPTNNVNRKCSGN